MKPWTFSASAAALLLFCSPAAFAITPDEVWQNWKAQAESAGISLSVAEEIKTGTTLELRGLRSHFEDGEGGRIETTLDQVVFSDRGDGSVAIRSPDLLPLNWIEAGGNADKPSAALQISQKGAELIASGTAAATRYDFTYPEVRAELVEAFDNAGNPEPVTLVLTAADVSGHYLVTEAAAGGFDLVSSLKTGPVSLRVEGEDEGETARIAFDLESLSSSAEGRFIDPLLMQDMAKALAAGFAMKSLTEHGPMTFSAEFEKGAETSVISGALESGLYRSDIGPDRVDYGLTFGKGFLSADLPEEGMAPGEVRFDEVTLGFDLPLGMTEVAQDFATTLRLRELTLSESIWSGFDPTGQIGRDPLTFILELTGKGVWLMDILAQDPLAAAQEVEAPVRLDALNLAELLIRLTGAEINGTGALTFDNNDLETFGGFPAPEGKITLNLSGISVLLDKAVALGLVGADELTGVRMGLAMFTRPGAGPDQLISEIEFRNKGLFINGQQIM